MQKSKKESPAYKKIKKQSKLLYVIIGILGVVVLLLLGWGVYRAGQNSVISSKKTETLENAEATVNPTITKISVSPTTSIIPTSVIPSKTTPKVTETTTPTPKVISRYAQYYGIVDKQKDPEFARYDGMHAFTIYGDNETFESSIYIVPSKSLSKYVLTKKHIYKLMFKESQIESRVKDDKVTTYVLTGLDKLEDTKLTYYWFGTYKRHAGDDWGPKYASDVYLYVKLYNDSGAIEYITFIPKIVADKLHFEIGRKYRVAFSFCEEEINDPTIKAYTCSGDAKVLEVK